MSYTYPEALNAMELIARDLIERARPGERVSVRVIADSVTGTASVDWSDLSDVHAWKYVTINMPVKPATYRMSAEEFDHWAAYVLHEVGHPLHTDKQTWVNACAALENNMLNYLEDVREEKCTIDLGLSVNAKQVFSKLVASLHAKGGTKGYDPNALSSIGWTLAYLGRAANGYDIDAGLVTKALDPKGIVAGIVPWALEELAGAKDTKACWDLAKKVIKAVNDAKAKQPKKPEPPKPPAWPEPVPGPVDVGGDHGPEDDAEGDDAEGDAAEGDDAEGDDAEGGEAPPAGGSGAGDGDGDGKGAGEKVAGDNAAEDDKPFTDRDVAPADMTPNDRDTMTSNSGKHGAARAVTEALREVAKKPVREAPIVGRATGNSVEIVAANASRMGQQRQLLARALKRNEEDSYDHGRPSGRLVGRDLAKVAVRDGNVFGKRHVNEGYDTDVQVLVDGSGSMSGPNIRAASVLALVVAQAASQVGVNCTAHVFNDNGLHAATKGREKPLPRKFMYMENQVMGGTPLTVNMLRAVKMQKARAGGKRKVLFLITDGGCNMGHEVLKAAGEYVEQVEGVEIANLYIGPKVMGLFRNEVAVNVAKVSATGLRQLTGLLEKGI